LHGFGTPEFGVYGLGLGEGAESMVGREGGFVCCTIRGFGGGDGKGLYIIHYYLNNE